jgi:ribonuclease VapC
VRLISAATLLERGIVIVPRRGEHAGRELDLFLHRAKFEALAKSRRERLLFKGEDFARTDITPALRRAQEVP